MTTESGKRRNYTEDFKRDAVTLVTSQGYTPSEDARSRVPGWSVDQRIKKALVIRALMTAIILRKPLRGWLIILFGADREPA